MEPVKEGLYAEEYLFYLRNRNFIRKLIRRIYLLDIRKYCKGKAIDFGCGVGELLSKLPEGSIGFEINSLAIDFCRSQGLTVLHYFPEKDNYNFEMIPEGKYITFTMNHVLEHIENSFAVIEKIFESCSRLGIERIVFTVPGYKGFNYDKTHRTFIDVKYFSDNGLLNNKNYELRLSKYFPVNNAKFGHYFTHNELRLVFDKRK